MQKIITLISVFTILTFSLKSQTSGPTQPDFMKFSQIETGKNVNEFDGSFNYSIPVLSIPSGNKVGYSLQLTYQSGLGPNDEATWVGFGWSLNPGSIVRQVKGFPDDFDGVNVTFINRSRPNLTKTDKVVLNGEFLSLDKGKEPPGGVGPTQDKKGKQKLSLGLIRNFNNYSGFTYSLEAGLNSSYGVNLNTSFENNGEFSVSLGLSPQNLLKTFSESTSEFVNKYGSYFDKLNGVFSLGQGFLNNDYGKGLMPMNLNSYTGTSIFFMPLFKYEQSPAYLLPGYGLESNLIPDLSYITNDSHIEHSKEDVKVYGFMNSGKGYDDAIGMMDYYNEKESGLSTRAKNLPIPFNNADNFVVSGNGIGGSFKLHSRKIGLFRPKYMNSTHLIINTNLTFGISNNLDFTIGIDPSLGFSKTSLQDWSNFVNINVSHPFDTKLNSDYSNFFYPYSFNKFYDHNYLEFVNQHNEWKNITSSKNEITENYFFKFNNDLTYSENSYNRNETNRFDVNVQKMFSPLALNVHDGVDLSANEPYWLTENNNGLRVPRSTYIDFNFYKGSLTNSNKSKIASYNTVLNDNADFDDFGYNYNEDVLVDKVTKIREFKITNKEGANYVYGLPVKNYNEVNASFNLKKIENYQNSDPYTLDGKIIYNTKFTIENLDEKNQKYNASLYGNAKIQNESYAGAYLLTNIYSPDYVDLTMDGPTIDDIGDYVLFHYRKADDIKWREPFIGLNYIKNSISDYQDDQGTVSYGKKELYYLESIETKTHIAIFITNKFDISKTKFNYRYKIAKSSENTVNPIELQGSMNNRLDAYPAFDNELESNTGSVINLGNNSLEYLEKIVLFSKDLSRVNDQNSIEKRIIYLDKKMQVTNLEYDSNYPIWNGMPNSKDDVGKLTLKNVWTDKEEVKEEKVAMYEFHYEYPSGTSYEVTNEIRDFHNLFSANAQFPNFNKLYIDRWGNYSYLESTDPLTLDLGIPGFSSTSSLSNNQKYLKTFQPFNIHRVNQLSSLNSSNNDNYDPAAWNLKHIILPNSGETEIEYEKNNFAFVQAENATNLFSADEIKNENGIHHIIIDPSKTINITSNLIPNYINFLSNKIVGNDIYYKYYYTLDDKYKPGSLFDCNHEYVDGYFKITSVQPLSTNSSYIDITVNGDIPTTKCIEYFEKRRFGLCDLRNSEPAYGTVENKIIDTELLLVSEFDKSKNRTFNTNSSCSELSPKLSFVKLPIPEYLPKYGGGIRVKRVINYDNFDSKAEENTNIKRKFYGNEYIYGDFKSLTIGEQPTFIFHSSGVATNEPYIGNEESALKQKINIYEDEKTEQLKITSLLSAKYISKKPDREEYEGPYCEGVLPSAKVSYSKIITKTIKSDINGNIAQNDNDIVVKEFNTVKDFPYNMNYVFKDMINSNNSKTINGSYWDRIAKKSYLPISFNLQEVIGIANLFGADLPVNYGLNIINNDYNFAQSYQFIVNTMHGQPKSVASYSAYDLKDNLTWKLNSSTNYEYFDLGEPVPIVDNLSKLTISNLNQLSYDWLGMYTEINSETRDLRTEFRQPKLDLDFKMGPIFPFFSTPTGGFSYTEKIEDYRYFTNNKIITLPNYLKKVKNYTNGIYSEIENVAFDPLTGDVAIKRISDNYDNIAATGGEMYPKSYYYEYTLNNTLNKNRDKMLSEANRIDIESVPPGIDYDALYRFKFKLIGSDNYLIMEPNLGRIFRADACKVFDKFNKGDIIKLNSKISSNNSINKFFVISENQCDVLLLKPLDESSTSSNIVSDSYVNFKLVKSGNTNQLGNNIAKIVTYGNDTIANSSYPINVFKILPIDKGPFPNVLFTNSNYTASPTNKWQTPIELRNILNDLISAFKGSIIPFPSTYIPYESLSSGDWTPYTILTPLTNLKIKNIKGECVDLTNANFKLSYRFMNYYDNTTFDNNNCPTVPTIDDLTYQYLHEFKPIGSTETILYKIKCKLYHLLIKIEFDDGIIPRSQVFNSYISEFKSAEWNPTPNTSLMTIYPNLVGLEQRTVPFFYLYGDNEIKFQRHSFWDLEGFGFTKHTTIIPPFSDYYDCESNIRTTMFTTHYNRSWCDKVAILNSCEYNKMDLFTDDKKVISANINQFNEFDKYSINDFSYVNKTIEAVKNPISPFTNSTTPPVISSGSTDMLSNLDDRNEQILNKILPSSSKLRLSNNILPLINSIIGSDNQSTPINNSLNISSNDIKTGGTFGGTNQNIFKLFNWLDDERNVDWINSNKLNYNNQMVPFIQKNSYDIYSGVGYDNYMSILPTYTINRYNPKLALVEDMENYNYLFLHNYNIDNVEYYKLSKISHTGKYSFILDKASNSDDYFISTNFLDLNYFLVSPPPSDIPDYKISLWIRSEVLTSNVDLKNSKFNANILYLSNSKSNIKLNHILQNSTPASPNIELTNKLQIGEWFLFEGNVPSSYLTNQKYLKLKISRSSTCISCIDEKFLLDDIRLVPEDAEITSFVYDWGESYKMKAVLDNENIPLKFIFDDKGDLKSKVASTYRGDRTISESFYNIPRVQRPAINTNNSSPILNSKQIKLKNELNMELNNELENEPENNTQREIKKTFENKIDNNIKNDVISKVKKFNRLDKTHINDGIQEERGLKYDKKVDQNNLKQQLTKDSTEKR